MLVHIFVGVNMFDTICSEVVYLQDNYGEVVSSQDNKLSDSLSNFCGSNYV